MFKLIECDCMESVVCVCVRARVFDWSEVLQLFLIHPKLQERCMCANVTQLHLLNFFFHTFYKLVVLWKL